MPIFIAKTYNGSIESVVLAKSYALAQAFWQGQGVVAHSITERSEADLESHPTGVLPIVKTRKIEASPFGGKSKEYLVISNK